MYELGNQEHKEACQALVELVLFRVLYAVDDPLRVINASSQDETMNNEYYANFFGAAGAYLDDMLSTITDYIQTLDLASSFDLGKFGLEDIKTVDSELCKQVEALLERKRVGNMSHEFEKSIQESADILCGLLQPADNMEEIFSYDGDGEIPALLTQADIDSTVEDISKINKCYYLGAKRAVEDDGELDGVVSAYLWVEQACADLKIGRRYDFKAKATTLPVLSADTFYQHPSGSIN